MRGWPLIKLLPVKTNFRFVSFARYAAVLSAVLVIASLVSVFYPGLNMGIDFRGGASMELTKPGGQVLVRKRDVAVMQSPVATGPRVGVSGVGGDAAVHPWRLWLTNEPTVSAYRPAYRSPASADAPPGATTSA